ncbi:MAG: tRNA (adenosine(37)-N6)-threonylcarbamoyltransferase complex ATPase subunit type 1 TsaE [Ruminococcaceae bacterium]|nr:tRNA (adenosine(37)-N6)-threonylcarbamoyltransferase complex ATPase subunit type 1 TsaE [Oscillospiraceae bacterium]
MEYTSDTEQTEALGKALAARMLSDTALPSFVALYGDLGVGKTAFVRGFASEIAPGTTVRSPTFALVNEYRAKPRPLFHFDMYRIDTEDDLLSIGFYDYLDRNGICLVEWSEKIPYALPDAYLRVNIEKCNPETPNQRKITIEKVEDA